MEKITYDIVFNLKNNPSSSLREINKVLIDIQRNTQNIASVVTTQMSMMQNPIDEARSKWLGLTKDTGAFFAVFSENSSGILLLITMYEKLEKLGATTKIASGISFISLIPPMFFSSLSHSFFKLITSFFGSTSKVPSSDIFSIAFNLLIRVWIVLKFVSIPPSHLSFT